MAQPNPPPSSSPSPIRVLFRPPSSTASGFSTSAPPSSTTSSSVDGPATAAASVWATNTTNSSSSSSSSVSPQGVVVVGFLGSRPGTDSTHLINKILDAKVFGSRDLYKDLLASRHGLGSYEEEWFRQRRICYYHDPDKGMVFLQFSSSLSPLLLLASSSRTGTGEYGTGSVSALEEYEADDLRGMLFMFSVCHVIILIHEGLRFDTQNLKRFRMLQNAKHALAPFIRSHIVPALSKPPPNPSLHTSSRASSVSPTNRRGGATSRHGSAISFMSVSGTHSSMLPGHCTPVILFVFSDDSLDGSNLSANMEDSADPSSTIQPASGGELLRPALNLKGSGPVVIMARPGSKTESSFKKKLHSSLETQVRFLIKKCRTLVGSEPTSLSSRGIGSVNALPLFLLDASRVIALVERSMIQSCEPLDFVRGLIEEACSLKTSLDIFSLEKDCQSLNYEDIQAVKDFIFRQVDILRGRGGLPSNSSSGSVAGVGMVAAAAAAAAASAASGKQLSAPELPSLERWLTLSATILESLLSVNDCFVSEGISKRTAIKIQKHDEQILRDGSGSIEAAVSCLESSKGLNMKFSTSWCQRALPAAKAVYLNGLPAFYPTSLHKIHLEKALHAFSLMVKGPAVQEFSRNLEDECTAIWESGRQLCDAVSLTGKPCMHPRHDSKTDGSSSEAGTLQHCSGYVFLHACACGRSRRLRADPFDFESANITFNCFSNCESLLQTLILPRAKEVGPLPENAWRLMRIAGASYYEPSKGLLQTGFCSNKKYLSKWTISIEKQKLENGLPTKISSKSSIISMPTDFKVLSDMDEAKKPHGDLSLKEVHLGSKNPRKKLEPLSVNSSNISFGKGLPSFSMKKPFSEVVAGISNMDSAFPTLQQSKQSKVVGKGAKQINTSEQAANQDAIVSNRHGPHVTAHISSQENTLKMDNTKQTDTTPVLQIGSNIVPVNIGSEMTEKDILLDQVIVYVGFEHECSYGHRFLLSQEHLNELDSSYSLPEESHSTVKVPDRNLGTSSSLYNYVSNETATSLNAMKKSPLKLGFEANLVSSARFDDGGSAYSLLNRKLPVYMNCPHCRNSTVKDNTTIKFASTISQLQRIFLVTPKFPTVLATCPVIQFEDSCLPPAIQNREQQSRFSIGSEVILPPESFLTLRLPFAYGVLKADGSLLPLNHFEHQPESTAWLVEGTTLKIISLGPEYDQEISKK